LTANDKMQTTDMPSQEVCIVYATFPAQDVAEAVGRALVAARLAACVNIFPAMTSIYEWDEALQRETEVAMLIKTTTARAPEVMTSVRRSHPHDNPAIVVLPVTDGSADFMGWIAAQTSRKGADAGEA
jgi:periplasmic divalent cation tolerance protein